MATMADKERKKDKKSQAAADQRGKADQQKSDEDTTQGVVVDTSLAANLQSPPSKQNLAASFNSPAGSSEPGTAKKPPKSSKKAEVHTLSVSHPDNQVTPSFCWQNNDVATATFETIMEMTWNGNDVELKFFFQNKQFLHTCHHK